jgi:hypothetical protein
LARAVRLPVIGHFLSRCCVALKEFAIGISRFLTSIEFLPAEAKMETPGPLAALSAEGLYNSLGGKRCSVARGPAILHRTRQHA